MKRFFKITAAVVKGQSPRSRHWGNMYPVVAFIFFQTAAKRFLPGITGLTAFPGKRHHGIIFTVPGDQIYGTSHQTPDVTLCKSQGGHHSVKYLPEDSVVRMETSPSLQASRAAR